MAKQGDKAGLKRLKEELKGTPRGLYLFYGEERYLLEHYLGALRAALIPEGMEEFNLDVFEGKGIDFRRLSDAIEAFPVLCERRMVVIRDLNLYRCDEKTKAAMEEILADIPEYCTVALVYDTVEYKTDARAKLHKLIHENGTVVEFAEQEPRELVSWLKRRFRALDRQIDTPEAEYMLFLCGRMMTTLGSEVAKVAAYCDAERVTRGDIDAVATPVIDAVIYELTDAVAAGRYALALTKLSDLVAMKYEPIAIVAALGRQMRQLYVARGVLREGGGERRLMELASIRSGYAAGKTLQTARRLSDRWCAEGIRLAADCDVQLKSTAVDKEEQVRLLLMRLAAIEPAS